MVLIEQNYCIVFWSDLFVRLFNENLVNIIAG